MCQLLVRIKLSHLLCPLKINKSVLFGKEEMYFKTDQPEKLCDFNWDCGDSLFYRYTSYFCLQVGSSICFVFMLMKSLLLLLKVLWRLQDYLVSMVPLKSCTSYMPILHFSCNQSMLSCLWVSVCFTMKSVHSFPSLLPLSSTRTHIHTQSHTQDLTV